MQAYAKKGVSRMYPWQAAALECGERGTHLVYGAPTSGGKSLVAEVLMLRRLLGTARSGPSNPDTPVRIRQDSHHKLRASASHLYPCCVANTCRGEHSS